MLAQRARKCHDSIKMRAGYLAEAMLYFFKTATARMGLEEELRRFVVGDIHGACRALRQCLDRASFDIDKDHLISLGDVCDGWPETDKVFEALLEIRHLTLLLSNHDQWALRWMQTGWQGWEWVSQGGQATLDAYHGKAKNVPASHKKLLENAPLYYELDEKLFVHGGVDPDVEIEKQNPDLLLWDRLLFKTAVSHQDSGGRRMFGAWREIYIGHTPTQLYGSSQPMHVCNVWALDTGCGWNGKLTMMDVESHEYVQSDAVMTLYPGYRGRQ